jgi:gamma-polyglutamate biosynthesis protein CapC
MIIESLFIGLLLGFVFYELTGISPGGVIAPGYFALYVRHPGMIATTLIIACGVWLALEVLAKYTVLYGRRKLLVALLLGFCVKLVIENWIQPLAAVSIDLRSVGYVIPGLVANEMARQKSVPTLASLGIVSLCVYLILQLLHP